GGPVAERLDTLVPERHDTLVPERHAAPAAERHGGAPDRHRTLRTTIGWSHELCLPADRLLWARLTVFRGPFDLQAAREVCAG
ncbi:regulator, partial [Streptomyces sp. SID11233]|nr:regulator [Streptomyces sp. SID11233]